MHRAVFLVSALLFVTGCGGDDESESGAPPASSPQAAEKTQAPDKASAGATAVEIKDFDFKPGELSVKPGDEVTWTNVDSANHNVIFDGDAAENIDNLRQDQKGSVTFEQTGTFKYVCSYHPGMEGSVVVQ